MKTINLIQHLQAAIDQLSFHSADTEVSLKAGISSLTGDINVSDPDTDGNIVVTLTGEKIVINHDLCKKVTDNNYSTISTPDLYAREELHRNRRVDNTHKELHRKYAKLIAWRDGHVILDK